MRTNVTNYEHNNDTKNIEAKAANVSARHARSIDDPKTPIVPRKSWLLCAAHRVIIVIVIAFLCKFLDINQRDAIE